MRSDSRYKLIRAASEGELTELKNRLAADPGVEYVEVNQTVNALFAPNDPYFANGAQWNFTQVKAPAAWDTAPGAGNGVIVAVLDTGVAYEDYGIYRRVPDLSPGLFVAGRDFVNGDYHPNDDHGHGTHVAGVIAQSTNNGYGAAGLAYGARIMPVKVLNKYGVGTSFDIADGIRWAADNGAKVINLSLGVAIPSTSIEDAIKYARSSKNVTVVAASGNGANEPGYNGGLMYPAAYPSVISVGATRYSKMRASYSQYGLALDLVAPGGEMSLGLDQNHDGFPDGVVQETIDVPHWGPADPSGHGFYWGEGTSVAAPHVTAAAAILIGQGVSDPDSVYQALTQTAQDLGAGGFDQKYGYGLLNIAAALKYRRTATTWYFAEGRTGKGFDTRIRVNNLSARTAKLRVTFSRRSGAKTVRRYDVGARTRHTIAVDDIAGLGSTAVSAKVKSINGVAVVAKREILFNYRGKVGSHVTRGAPAVAPVWNLAEGNTRGTHETQLIVYNPSDEQARFRATFTKLSGVAVGRDYAIGAWGRKKVVVDAIAGLGSARFTTKVESLSSVGIVAERFIY